MAMVVFVLRTCLTRSHKFGIYEDRFIEALALASELGVPVKTLPCGANCRKQLASEQRRTPKNIENIFYLSTFHIPK